ncbi:MAG: 5-(carboxyamino)imidazole ribonucleotide synthase [Synechococcaceae bacterium WB8_1B_136]|nr:5-(carboxyamino)imidazole ribonucleotide synthase [Synechococcaceae bacterium WB8_1B_136]
MGASIGIVGGGQLAWMLAQAARRDGVPLHVQTPNAQDPAVELATSVVQAEVDDISATRELAQRCTAISFENEWLDLDGLAPLQAEGVQFVPSLEALRPLLSKRSQRELLQRLDLPSPRWMPLDQVVSTTEDPPTLPEGFSFPLMAKAASGGYDGKGTAVLRSPAELEALVQRVDPSTWILEEFVRFEQELALVAARDQQGEVVCFPLVQTHQHQQVCEWVLAPAEASHGLQQAARNIAASLLTSLNYVGVLSIEFFHGPGGLMVNELAPRTHNSGHYTIEACSLSQFDQQLRVVVGDTAQEPALVVPGALMVNLLGLEGPDAGFTAQRQALEALPNAHLHWYGKTGASLGRKLGHVTVLLQQADGAARRQEAMQRLQEVRQIWPLPTVQNDPQPS